MAITKLSDSSITTGDKYISMLAGNLPTSNYESIASVTVGAGGQANVEFTSISNTYTHLQIRYAARTSRVASAEDIDLQLNLDTANNYSWHILYGDGANPVTAAGASTYRMIIPGVPSANATASFFGAGVVDILDYTSTNKFKTVRSLGGNDRISAGEIMFESGSWRSTSAVTSLKLTPSAGSNFVQYSVFALYGIRGSL